MPDDAVYMSSPINALLEGFYETNLTIGMLKEKGDFGIGTFNDLDGELLLVDGEVFQLDVNAIAHRVRDDVKTPFASACFFRPFSTEEVESELDYPAFSRFLDQCLPSPNMLYAIRVEGFFRRVRTRSVPRTANYTPLVEATAEQKEACFEQVEGTLVGFYTPGFIPSVNVPGYHFHFIDAARSQGGHLLECHLLRGKIQLQSYSRLDLNIPMTMDYLCAEFERDARKDIEQAER